MKNYVDIQPSLFYTENWLIDHYIDGELIGSNYLPLSFTGQDIQDAKNKISVLSTMISYPMKGPSQ